MDRSRTIDQHSINRIAAVLLALADVAERASGRSVAVRSLVLWLLRSGEVLARDHLAGLTPDADGFCRQLPLAGDSAGEAIRLARSFRELAAAIVAIAVDIVSSPRQEFAALRSSLYGKRVATDPLPPRCGPMSAVGRRDSS